VPASPPPGPAPDDRRLNGARVDTLLRVVLRGQGVTPGQNTASAARLQTVHEIQRAALSDSAPPAHRVLTIVREMLDARDRLNTTPDDQDAWMTLLVGWEWLPALRADIDVYLDGPSWTEPPCTPYTMARSRAIVRCPRSERDEPHRPHAGDGWVCGGIPTYDVPDDLVDGDLDGEGAPDGRR
jgi:hypothetical protein